MTDILLSGVIFFFIRELVFRKSKVRILADPKWVVVEVKDEDQVIGYRVAWSEKILGKTLLVRHYLGDGTISHLRWCEVAAESNAKMFNKQKRCPWEFK